MMAGNSVGRLIKSSKYPDYNLWDPHDPNQLCQDLGDYEVFEDIRRTIHFEDYLQVIKNGTISPTSISESSNSRLSNDFKGLWFGVPEDGHNWYGNVSFQLNFNKFLSLLNPAIYFLEVLEYRTKTATRLLLTTQRRDKPLNFKVYDPSVKGGSWYRDPHGINHHLKDIRRYDGNYNGHGNALEIILELSPTEYKWLYDSSVKLPANHQESNDPGYCKCKKYRSGGRNELCPSPWAESYTLQKMISQTHEPQNYVDVQDDESDPLSEHEEEDDESDPLSEHEEEDYNHGLLSEDEEEEDYNHGLLSQHEEEEDYNHGLLSEHEEEEDYNEEEDD